MCHLDKQINQDLKKAQRSQNRGMDGSMDEWMNVRDLEGKGYGILVKYIGVF